MFENPISRLVHLMPADMHTNPYMFTHTQELATMAPVGPCVTLKDSYGLPEDLYGPRGPLWTLMEFKHSNAIQC